MILFLKGILVKDTYNYMSTYIEVYLQLNLYLSFVYTFINLNMPINVFGNSNSNNSDNKIDTSLFVQKPYLRTNYIEANIEEDIDFKKSI